MYGVRLILDELLYGTRPIITNLPIKLGELNKFVQDLAGERVVDVVGRIRLLTDEETGHFWSYRFTGRPVKVLTKMEWSQGLLPSYADVKDHGVMYVIDEVHNYFGARQWAETGRDVLFYLSQHRHLGDTVVCITQAITNVDKQFRSVAQDFTVIKNMSKVKMGLFRMPYVFLRTTYPTPPTSDTVKATETATFRLDVTGLAACYDTSIGVGIHARGADLKERRKGVPWQAGIVGLLLFLWLAVTFVPKLIASAINVDAITKPVTQMQQSGVFTTNAVPVGAPVPAAAAGPPAAAAPAAGASGEVWCTSVVRIPGVSMSATLSNGRRYKLGDGQCTALLRNGAVVGGVFYELRDRTPSNF